MIDLQIIVELHLLPNFFLILLFLSYLWKGESKYYDRETLNIDKRTYTTKMKTKMNDIR